MLVAGLNGSGALARAEEKTPPDSKFVSTASLNGNPDVAPIAAFDPAAAQDFLAFTRLPMEYEEMLLAGKTAEEAREAIDKKLPEGVEGTVIRHQNSTAVVSFDAAQGVIRVAYDGTSEPADKKDNARFWREASPIGGRIYTGFYDAILKESPDGQNLVDAVRQKVEDYAAQAGKPVTLDLTGFSKGGSMAITTAAQWIADGFADGQDGIRMKNVYTFANPAAGDEKFCSTFENAARASGVNVSRVVAGGDAVPHILTETAPWYMPGLYHQCGDAFYIGVDKQGSMRAVENPGTKDAETFRDNSPKKVWHDPDVYEQAIRDYVTSGMTMTEPAAPEKSKPSTTAPRIPARP